MKMFLKTRCHNKPLKFEKAGAQTEMCVGVHFYSKIASSSMNFSRSTVVKFGPQFS